MVQYSHEFDCTHDYTSRTYRDRGGSLIGGGGAIFLYSCSTLLISFEIYCFYAL